jgi:PAS domain S-box-containing protein
MSKREVKQTKQFRSLTVTLATAFLALSAVVLFIVSSLNMYFNFQNQRKLISSQQNSTAQRAASTVKSFIQEKFTTLETAFNIGNLARTRHKEQKLVLEKLLGLEPAFRQLVLLGEQEQELVKVSRVSKIVSANLTERVGSELLSELSLGKRYISPIFIDEITSEPMVIIGVPVTDVFGDVEGLVMAEVNLKFMWDLVDSIKVGKKGLAYVVDKHGTLIAFGDISRVLGGENLIHLSEVAKFVVGDEIIHKSSATISKGILNTQVVSDHAHLGMPDWAVVVELPVLEAYETVVNALLLSVVVVFFSFFLAIVAGIYLSKKITNPIIKLRDATRRIGKGKLNTKIEVQSKDEIGDLAVSFNQMIKDLKRITVSHNSLAKEVKQRKLAEEELRESEKRFKILAEHAPLGISILAPDRSFEYLNPRFTQIFGYTIEDIPDKDTWFKKAYPDEAYRKKLIAIWNRDTATALRTGKENTRVFTVRCKNGEDKIIDFRRIDLKYGKLYQIYDDITVRTKAEEALQRAYDEIKASEERELERAAQLEASNRELEAFSYSVSHDLRAPLRGIDGFSQALLEDYADQLDTQGKDYLQRVRAATQRLEYIIDDMLLLSRVTRSEMRREVVNLSTMAQEIAAEFQVSQSERQVSFVIAPGLVVKADPNLIRIALENLLDNAWKFTSKHVTARIEVGVTANKGKHAYYVRDDGAGFDMAYADKLFGAFQRLHPITDFGGTGIGLATVQRIIHRHGGRVWAEGAVEQGATFHFTLPR